MERDWMTQRDQKKWKSGITVDPFDVSGDKLEHFLVISNILLPWNMTVWSVKAKIERLEFPPL